MRDKKLGEMGHEEFLGFIAHTYIHKKQGRSYRTVQNTTFSKAMFLNCITANDDIDKLVADVNVSG